MCGFACMCVPGVCLYLRVSRGDLDVEFLMHEVPRPLTRVGRASDGFLKSHMIIRDVLETYQGPSCGGQV